MGVAPQRAAKEASFVRRSGLSPAADEQSRGHVGADASGAQQGGVRLGAQAGDLAVEFADLAAERLVAASEDAQRLFGGGDDLTAGGVGAQARAGVHQDAQ